MVRDQHTRETIMLTLMHPPPSLADPKLSLVDKVIDLQQENLRLQRLVGELLLKNERLRSESLTATCSLCGHPQALP